MGEYFSSDGFVRRLEVDWETLQSIQISAEEDVEGWNGKVLEKEEQDRDEDRRSNSNFNGKKEGSTQDQGGSCSKDDDGKEVCSDQGNEIEHLDQIGLQYGVFQRNDDGDMKFQQKVTENMHKMENYMRSQVSAEQIKDCQNEHELCLFWATMDECTKNPSYMLQNCKPACLAC